MFEIRAKCDNSRCPNGVFLVERRKVVKKSTSGQDYTIGQVVCPECRMWAKVTRIREKSATCGSKSAVERLVLGPITHIGLQPAATLRIVREWADHEELKVRGKTLATSLGHPEWENVCQRCGDVEIPVDEKECKRCTVLGWLGR